MEPTPIPTQKQRHNLDHARYLYVAHRLKKRGGIALPPIFAAAIYICLAIVLLTVLLVGQVKTSLPALQCATRGMYTVWIDESPKVPHCAFSLDRFHSLVCLAEYDVDTWTCYPRRLVLRILDPVGIEVKP